MTRTKLDYFITEGIYKLNTQNNDNIFLCENLGNIGKLTLYKKEKDYYKRTNIAYFLSCYDETDVKSLFVKRENYDMIGQLTVNYIINEDRQTIKPV